jgi:uncharacterized phage protein (TIGR02220 family)
MPQRFLRPEIRNSSRWNAVSLKAQSLWIRLLTMVDDFGRCDGRASVICGNCWAVWNERHPSDAVNPQETAALCCELKASGLIEIYTSGDKEVLQLLQWQERARSEKSKWPDPQESAAERSGTQPNPASLALVPSPSPSPNGLGACIPKGGHWSPDARVALAFLNEVSGKHFRETDANLRFIESRLSEPEVTLDGVKQMVRRQVKLWNGTDMEKYIRPETIFNATKFQSYYADRGNTIYANSQPNHQQRPNRNIGTANENVDYAAYGRLVGEIPGA